MSLNVKRYVAAYITIALVAFGLGAWVDMPVLAQQPVCPAVVPVCGGGSDGGITAGTTAITSGTNTRVIFNDGGVWGEDAGLVYNKTTDVLTVGGLTALTTDVVARTNFGAGWTGTVPKSYFDNTANIWTVSGGFTFGASYNTPDSGLRRLAAGVIGSTLGGADNGWVQNSAGELALNADYTNATATFSNTNLSATLVSGRTYSFTAALFMADSTAADGMKLDFNGGAATITNFRVSCAATNDTTGATVAFTAATSTTLAGVINIPTMASTGTHAVVCEGTIVPSSSNTFILRAAQNAHTTGTLTVYRGSGLSIRDARPL